MLKRERYTLQDIQTILLEQTGRRYATKTLRRWSKEGRMSMYPVSTTPNSKAFPLYAAQEELERILRENIYPPRARTI